MALVRAPAFDQGPCWPAFWSREWLRPRDSLRARPARGRRRPPLRRGPEQWLSGTGPAPETRPGGLRARRRLRACPTKPECASLRCSFGGGFALRAGSRGGRRRRALARRDDFRYGPSIGNEILPGNALYVVGRDLVVIIELGEELAPIAVLDVGGGQLSREAGVVIELAYERSAQAGFDTFQRFVIDLFRLQAFDDGVTFFLVLLEGVPGVRNQVEEEEVGILTAGEG